MPHLNGSLPHTHTYTQGDNLTAGVSHQTHSKNKKTKTTTDSQKTYSGLPLESTLLDHTTSLLHSLTQDGGSGEVDKQNSK